MIVRQLSPHPRDIDDQDRQAGFKKHVTVRGRQKSETDIRRNVKQHRCQDAALRHVIKPREDEPCEKGACQCAYERRNVGIPEPGDLHRHVPQYPEEPENDAGDQRTVARLQSGQCKPGPARLFV